MFSSPGIFWHLPNVNKNLVAKQQCMKKGKKIKYDNNLALQEYLTSIKIQFMKQQKLIFFLRCETKLSHHEAEIMYEFGCNLPNNNQHI